MKQKIQILKNDAFPFHEFFNHLRKGTAFYQNNNFERAAEEWAAARWMKYDEPIRLKRLEGRIFCGGHIHEVPFHTHPVPNPYLHLFVQTSVDKLNSDPLSHSLTF